MRLYADDMTSTCSVNWMDLDRLQISLNAAVSETVLIIGPQQISFHLMRRKPQFLPSAAIVFPTESLMTLFLLMDRNLKTYNVQSF